MAKKALLIGVNRYRVPGADLRGCVNDVKNLKSALGDHCGFAQSDIRVLTDLDATTKAIQKGIAALVASGKKGDVLLLHFSGHGSNVPDADGDEADRRDEILCPTDLDWKAPLLDDWLRKAFDRVRAGVNLTVIFDCCHSGTATRAVFPPDAPSIPRYLPSPWDLVASESGRSLRGRAVSGLYRSRRAKRKKSDVVIADIGEVLVSGCRDTQTSADAYIDGSYNGALTYYLAAALRAEKGKVTYRELHEQTLKGLARGGYSQVPQLEGRKANLDRAVLAPVA